MVVIIIIDDGSTSSDLVTQYESAIVCPVFTHTSYQGILVFSWSLCHYCSRFDQGGEKHTSLV